jgi:CheY-like chemotaxis protein
MTAHAMKGDREKCLEAGMNDYLPKPISPDALSEKLEHWLGDRMERAVEAESVTSRLNRERKASAATVSFVPAAAGSGHLPVVFDRGSFLERLLGDEELAERVLKEFLGDIPRQIAELRAYIQRPAADHAAGQAHKIKGAAANVGGMVLSAVALEMEKAGKDHDWVRLQQLLPRLESEFERLRAVMQGE